MSRSLRIGIDAHSIGPSGTGNARFIANVITELQRSQEQELVLYFTSAPAARAWPRVAGTQVRVIRPSNPLIRIPIGIPRAARRDGLDVILVQYTASARVTCPVVTIVHDVSFAAHPEYFSRSQRLWMPRSIPATMKRAAAVITVSEFSKSEIMKYSGVPGERIHVASDAPDPSLSGKAPADGDLPLDPPFFLALGTVELRKNIDVAIRAFALLGERGSGVRERLVVAGGDGYRAAETRRAAEGVPGIEFLGYLPDAQVAALLSGATALVYPSRYEGFGLPVVEAMAAGTPALVSDIPVMREIAGDAAVRLPPDDVHAWADALERVSNDSGFRAGVVERATLRARDFSWEKTAGIVRSVLEKAAKTQSE